MLSRQEGCIDGDPGVGGVVGLCAGRHSPVTDDFGKAAYRRYGRDDMLLLESLGKVWLLWGWRQDGAEKLGLTEDVAAGRVTIDCASRRVVSGPAS